MALPLSGAWGQAADQTALEAASRRPFGHVDFPDGLCVWSAMGKKKRKAASPIRLGQILPEVMRTVRGDDDTDLLRVWEVWDHAVGDAVAENAQPAAFKGDVLIVHVASSVWGHHLQFLKADILEALNEALGDSRLKEITFKTGTI
jgi:predicted nucleic acid-binding Zn ribbon protein